MKNLPLKEIAAKLLVSCDSNFPVTGFAIDSRKIQAGELFFALPGAKVDGHAYLEEVAKKGACGAVVLEDYQGEHFGLELIRTRDVKDALQELGKIAAAGRPEKRIAITGSMGKTTTKEFLAGLLKKRFRVKYTEGNCNTQLTFPLFWLNLEGECDFCIVEMGMTCEGHIRKLVDIAPPDIAIITRIGSAHIAFFQDGFKGIARAKSEIFSNRRTKIGIAHTSSMEFDEIRPHVQWTYGEDGDFLIKTLQAGIVVEQKNAGESPFLEPPFRATHLLENLLGAICIARLVGADWEDIRAACTHVKPHALRYETEVREGVVFVKDCYNANPVSMRAAMSNLPPPVAGGRRIGVLGAMVDQGAFSVRFHTEVAEFALQHLDAMYCIGEESAPMVDTFTKAGRPVQYFADLPTLKQHLFASVRAGDVVLIKGSNFLKLWQLME